MTSSNLRKLKLSSIFVSALRDTLFAQASPRGRAYPPPSRSRLAGTPSKGRQPAAGQTSGPASRSPAWSTDAESGTGQMA
eukprot:14184383-Heterocapsa_arctica.AAC.1